MSKQNYRDPRGTRQSRPADTDRRTCRCPVCGRDYEDECDQCDTECDQHLPFSEQPPTEFEREILGAVVFVCKAILGVLAGVWIAVTVLILIAIGVWLVS